MARSAENSVAGALAGTTAGGVNYAKASQTEAASARSMSRGGPTFANSVGTVTRGGFGAVGGRLPLFFVNNICVRVVISVPLFCYRMLFKLARAHLGHRPALLDQAV
jgi:hypothetical protein